MIYIGSVCDSNVWKCIVQYAKDSVKQCVNPSYIFLWVLFSLLSNPVPRIAVPEAPMSVKALVTSAESILVSWLSPARPNGIITQYTVYFKEHGAPDEDVRYD